jgi:hypothetical protein
MYRWRLRHNNSAWASGGRGQACGGVLEAMARTASERPAMPRSTIKYSLGHFPILSTSKNCYGISWYKSVTSHQSEPKTLPLAKQRNMLNPPVLQRLL